MRGKTFDVPCCMVIVLACGVLAACARTTASVTPTYDEATPVVMEAVTCLAVQEREPLEPGDWFPANVGRVWCWSKIKDGEGTTIKHIYYHGNTEAGVVELPIRSPLWRTFSSKNIPPGWTGQWRVDIVDANGTVLKSLGFIIGEGTQPK